MPRIAMYADKYADADFQKEIYRRMADRYEEVSVRALAREIGACQSTLNTKIRKTPCTLVISELRKIVSVLKPDPVIMLKLLGYTSKEINKFKNQKEETVC